MEQSNEKKIKITHSGELEIGDYKIPCYLLEDGQRILSTTGMQRALGIVNDENERSATKLTQMLSLKLINTFLSDV